MNEQIKRLAEQAGFENIKFWNPETRTWASKDEMLQEFALMIIRNCTLICATERAGNIEYNQGRIDCITDINNRFGLNQRSSGAPCCP